MESFLELFEPEKSLPRRKKSYDLSNRGYEKIELETCSSVDQEDKLPPEPELGNIEYKLKLINPSSQRFEHLVTQMKWRLREGHGEAIYQIGVEDNGRLAGLSREDMKLSLETLKEMAGRLGAEITVLRERLTKCKSRTSKVEEKRVAEVLVRKLRKGDTDDNELVVDLRLAVLGGQDAGKSTLLGVLTQGELDNGRGRARLNIFRHLHEIKTGRTSSISHEILGFDNDGQILNYSEMKTAEEICDNASKVVTFIDLAGHRKYLRTTLLGLMGYSPHYVMLVFSQSTNDSFKEHLTLCLALRIPFFIVVTKIDVGYRSPREIVSELETILETLGCPEKLLAHINNNEDREINNLQLNSIPVFFVSSVTGEGLGELTNFIRDLPPTEASPIETDPESCLFQIDETFRVVGLDEPVLGGLLVKGLITPGTRLLVGPLPDGKFSPVKVVSLHRNKIPCCVVRASQSASLTIASTAKRDLPLPLLRPGMVLVSSREPPHATLFFQATIYIVYHPTAIYPGFQATVHAGNVRQTCIFEGIMEMKDSGLKTKETASVLLRFACHPEYLHVGMRLLLREGRAKAIGEITQIFPLIGSQNAIE